MTPPSRRYLTYDNAVAYPGNMSDKKVRKGRGRVEKSPTKKNKATKTKKKPSATGRPTKYTKDRIDKFLDLVRLGNFKTISAQACGFTSETLSQWEKKKAGFAESIKIAEAEGEAALVARITSASREYWTAAAWLLERKSFERWGKKDKREISGHLLSGTPEEVQTDVVGLFKGNPDLWRQVKEEVDG